MPRKGGGGGDGPSGSPASLPQPQDGGQNRGGDGQGRGAGNRGRGGRGGNSRPQGRGGHQPGAGPQQQHQQTPRPQQPYQQGPRPQQQHQPGPWQHQGPRPQQQHQQGPWQQQGPRPQQQHQQGPWPQQQGPRPQQQQHQQGPWPQQQGPRPQQQHQQGPWQQQGPRPQQQQHQQGPWPQQQGPRPQQQPQQHNRTQQQPEQGLTQEPSPAEATSAAVAQPAGPGAKKNRGKKSKSGRTQETVTPEQPASPPVEVAMSALSVTQPAVPEQPPGLTKPEAAPPQLLQVCKQITPGRNGRVIPVESNHLALSLGKKMDAVHYDVDITPDTPKFLLRPVMNQMQKLYYSKRFPAFDGRKNLYSSTMLPFGETLTETVKVLNDSGKEKEFKVTIKFARMVDLSPLHDMLKTKKSPMDALQCVDIVLRNAPSTKLITVGRSFFSPPVNGQIITLGEGMEMYYGFYQSAIRGWKPLLNVDVAHKPFPTAMPVLDLICSLGCDYRQTPMARNQLERPLQPFVMEKLEKFLRGIKVEYEIPRQPSSKRIYKVNGLDKPASNAMFQQDDGSRQSVAQYFQIQKRSPLRYPHLPTLWVGSKERASKILLPLEYCTVVGGQSTNRKMTENQTSQMIRRAATSTHDRKKKIMENIGQVNYNTDPCVQEFGFSVNSEFEKLQARVLVPPRLQAGDRTIMPSKGVWRNDGSFLRGAKISKWTILSIVRQMDKRNDTSVNRLANEVYNMGSRCGMQFETRADTPEYMPNDRQLSQNLIDYFHRKASYDLIFVIVPQSGPTYSYVKKAAELNVGCLTQCVKDVTVDRKLNGQTVANILLKVNSKMNGTNHCLEGGPARPMILKRPCMIMGADVTHPGPEARDIPSVAAVTASHDPKAFHYNICWRLQPPKVEIIEDLKEITREQLLYFYQMNKCRPEVIVFFRDGVSEGQFDVVRSMEITAIRAACKQLQADGYEPKITFLVVQKRHHTRFFPLNPGDSEDKKNFNVPAGTCVDTVITNPMMQDFYLVSHASIQGVAKPTKYCTLWDDNNMTNDAIQELTYHLCHMFTRCNRSVSYPAPTYYAHLAAARAKVYIENDRLQMDKLKELQEKKYKIQDRIVKGKPMFFV